MGVRNSKEVEANFMNDYDIIQTIPSDNITFLQHKKTEEEYLLREFTFNDKKESERTLQKLSELKDKLSGCKHVVPLKDYLMNSEDQYCSTFYKIYALFEYPQRTLEDEINDRRLKMKRFSETELWSILASCIVGLSHLQKNDIRHSALKSNRILLSREGIIKVSDPFAMGDNTNYDNALTKRSSQHAYLSPEQTQALQQEEISPNYNPYKSDIFTLGMIILEAGLFEYQDEQCYRDEKTRIHYETLQYNIDRLGQAYSNEIKNMVEIMLSRDERARPDWTELEGHVMKGDELSNSFIQEERVERDASVVGNYPISNNNYSASNNYNSSNGQHNVISYGNQGNGSGNLNNLNQNFNQSSAINAVNTVPMVVSQSGYQTQGYNTGLGQTFGSYSNNIVMGNNTLGTNALPSSNLASNNLGLVGKTMVSQHPMVIPSQRQTISSTISGHTNQIHLTQAPVISGVSQNISGLGSIPQPSSSNGFNVGSGVRTGSGISLNNNALGNQNYQNTQNIINGQSQSSIVSGVNSLSSGVNNVTNNGMNSLSSGVNNVIRQNNSNIAPLKPSIIEETRPTRNIFPSDTYTIKTKYDENLVVINDDEEIESNNGEIRNSYNYESGVPTPNIQNYHNVRNQENVALGNNAVSQFSSPSPSQGSQFQGQVQSQGSQGSQIQRNAQFQGSQGSQGFQNSQGSQGFQNSQGSQGFQGSQGSQGFQNSQLPPQMQVQKGSQWNSSSSSLQNNNQPIYTTEEFKLGSRYEGYKLNGQRHGYGKFYYQDGGMYDGNWSFNRMSGKGSLYYQSGKLAYEGDWKDDQFMGIGTLYNENPEPLPTSFDYTDFDGLDEYWTKYVGQFEEDAKNGKGTLYLSNGEKFEGNFVNDTIEGPGVFYTLNGTKIVGNWINNKKV